ncbi:HD domain-containing protein [Desulfobotulus sp. H1]|uniref:5'-deoxynucleotidase n=1 Tax=Desulfobotulus pelophilus TaxID=2823377 RepID=A0ABT3N5I0_9BACT|nr:HD domain-containing protein [Desulfobotulus pelophilus]MCW7752712.1 HD domain-containing protein [Desulfobotulus pelophilus]
MQRIVHLLFEALMLKRLPRSGYHFLGSGSESVAEHSFMITMIAYVMGQMNPEADQGKLMAMCLLHDLPEARMGDLNYVQKKYVCADEKKAVRDLVKGLSFGGEMVRLLDEFTQGESLEARLARDADQLAFLVDLKALADTGRRGPAKWMGVVEKRILTETGRSLAQSLLDTDWDAWWLEKYAEPPREG